MIVPKSSGSKPCVETPDESSIHIDLPDKNALGVNHHSPERALALRKPQAHSLIVIEKITIEKGQTTRTRHYYASSHRIENKSNAYFHKLIRGHWKGCETGNHWIKDHLWKEDKTRIRTWSTNANLSLLRSSILNLKAHIDDGKNWAEFFEYNSHFPNYSLKLISKPRSK